MKNEQLKKLRAFLAHEIREERAWLRRGRNYRQRENMLIAAHKLDTLRKTAAALRPCK